MKTMGVYKITQRSTGVPYIGSSVDISLRWKKHVTDLNCGRHHAIWLQRAWTKHGKEDFSFEILEVLEVRENLRTQEAMWLSKHKPNFNNLQPSSGSGVFQHGQESKSKMSSSQKNRFNSVREKNGGKVLSKEHISLLQQRRRETVGWNPSIETKEKMSISARNKPPVTAETRERLRQANLKRTYPPMSEAQKVKLSAAHKGKRLTPEHRAKIGAGLDIAYKEGRHPGTTGLLAARAKAKSIMAAPLSFAWRKST